jgi:hypothetical protein
MGAFATPLPNPGCGRMMEMDCDSPIPLEVSMKRAIALLVAGFCLTAIAAGAADSTKINGWISDSMCGAKHTGSGKDCVIKCIKMGQAPVFVDESKKAVWSIDNPGAVKSYYGDHVTITASTNEATKSVHIDSIAEAK